MSFGSLSAATLGGLTGNQNLALTNGTSAAVALTVGQNNGSTAYSGNLTGSGSLTKSGTGIFTLGGSGDSYSGGTTVTGGLINFNALAQFGSGALVLSGGGVQYTLGLTADVSSLIGATGLGAGNDTIDTNVNNETFGTALGGAGTLVKAGAGTLFLSRHDTYTGGTIITNGLIDFTSVASGSTNFGTGVITLAGGGLQYSVASTGTDVSPNITLGTGLDTIDTNGTTETFATSVPGTGTLVKAGAGTLILDAVEGYTGGTVINVGTLQLGNGAVNGSMNATLPSFSNIQDNAVLNFDEAGSTSFGGIISGTGNLTQVAANTLTLTGASTFDGTASILSGGTLTLGISTALQNATLSYTTTGGAFSFGSLPNAALGGLSGNQTLPLTNNGSAAVALTVGANGFNTTYSGILSGSGSLTKIGNGTLTLNPTGTNSYAGNTTVNGGTLDLASAGALSNAGTSALIVNNASVLNGLGGALSINNNQTWSGNLNYIGSFTFGNAATPSTLTLASNSTLNLSGNVLVYNVNPANATLAGAAGNNVSITYVKPGTANSAASLSVTGNAIVINLATDANDNVSSTANSILNLIGNSSVTNGTAAGNLVTVALGANSTGTGLLNASALASLTGGNATSNATLTSIFGTTTINDAIVQTGTPGETLAVTGAGNLTFGGNGTAAANLTSSINAPHLSVTGNEVITIGTGAVVNAGAPSNATNQGYNVFGFNPGDNVTLTLTGNGILNSGNVEVGLGNTGALQGVINSTLNIGGTSQLTANDLWIGEGSTGDSVSDFTTALVNQTGGTVILTGNSAGGGGLQLGGQFSYVLSSTNVTYNFSGGNLETTSIVAANVGTTGSVLFNFNGGILTALANSSIAGVNGATANTTFISGGALGVNSLVDNAGGAIINTNGFNITIAQNLTHNLTLGLTLDGGLTKVGAGTLTFPITQNDTYTGNTTLGNATTVGGTLNVSQDSALGGNPNATLIFGNTATLQLGSTFTLGQGRTVSIGSSLTGIIDTQTYTLNFGGNIVGHGSLEETGSGTLNLFGFNTYNGSTIINSGTLELNYASPGAPSTNMINGTSALVLNGGGTLLLQAIPVALTDTQNFSSTQINGGTGVATVTINGSAAASGPTVNLNFGPMSRTTGGVLELTEAGNGSLNFLTPSSAGLNAHDITDSDHTPFVVLSTANNGVDWGAYGNASTTGAPIVPLNQVNGYTLITSAANLSNVNSPTESVALSSPLQKFQLSSNVTMSDISYLTPQSVNPIIDINQIYAMAVGGVLVSNGIGNGNTAEIADGAITPVAAGGDLLVVQGQLGGSSGAGLIFTNTILANVGGQPTSLVKMGVGNLAVDGGPGFNGFTPFTGNTYLDQGFIQLSPVSTENGANGTTVNSFLENSELIFQGGSLNIPLNPSGFAQVGGIAGTQNIVILSDGTLALTPRAGVNAVLSGNINSLASAAQFSLIMAGPGSETLSGNNFIEGGIITLEGGTLKIGGAAIFGNGTTNTEDTLYLQGGSIDSLGFTSVVNNTTLTNTLNPIPISFVDPNNINPNGAVTYVGSTTGLTLGLNGNITLATSSSSATNTITVTNNTLTLAGVIGGNSEIVKAGPGALQLTGNNGNITGGVYFNGNILLTGGNLVVTNDLQLGLVPTLTGTTASSGNILIEGGALNANFAISGNRVIEVGNATLGNGTFNVSTNTSTVVSGYIEDVTGNTGGILQLEGNGTLVLNGGAANTYTGGTVLSSGILNIISTALSTAGTADGALGAAAAGVTFTGNATLQAGTTTDLNAARLVTVSPGVTGNLNTNGQALSIEGTITGTSINANLTTSFGTSNSNLILAVNGTNASLTGVNATAGDNVTIQYVKAANGTASTTAAVTGNVITVTLSDTANGVINATAANVLAAINANSSVAALITPSETSGSNGNGVVALLGTSNLSGAVLPGTLNEAGTGILTLNGSSNFTGGLTLNAGTLNIGNAQALGTGTLTINGGAFDNTIGANANITYTAVASGAGGNSIKISYVNGGANKTLGIDPASNGTNIIVDLGTNSEGSVTSSAAQIVSLIDNTGAFSNLSLVNTVVLAQDAGSGAGFATPMAATSLAGGGTNTTAALTTALGVNATMSGNPQLLINGNFTYLGTATSLSMGSGNVTLSTTPSITVSNNSLTLDGVISGAGLGLTKLGNGTLVLGAQNTYNGITTVDGGTLALDFTQPGAPTNNILSTASTLAMGGGATLAVIGNGTDTQSVTTNPLIGGSNLSLTNNATGVLTVNLGTITRSPGGAVNIIAPGIVDDLVFAANTTNFAGANGNGIKVVFATPTGASDNVTVTGSGNSSTITVTPKAGGDTLANITAAIEASANATALVSVSNVGLGNVSTTATTTLSGGAVGVAAGNTTAFAAGDVVTTVTGSQGFQLADPNTGAQFAVVTFPVNSNNTFAGTTTDFAAIGPGGTIVPYSTIGTYFGDSAANATLVAVDGELAPSVGNQPLINTDIPSTSSAINVTNNYAINSLRFNQPNGAPGNVLNINGTLGVNGILVSANVAGAGGAAPIIGGTGNLEAANPGGELAIFTYGNFGAGVSSLFISTNITNDVRREQSDQGGHRELELEWHEHLHRLVLFGCGQCDPERAGRRHEQPGGGKRDPQRQQPGRLFPVRLRHSHGEHRLPDGQRLGEPAGYRHDPERGDAQSRALGEHEQHL